jgi:hypothetical protein
VFGVGLALLSGLHFFLSLPWAAHWSWSFDSDEAIFGLMARHIQQGQLPLFYYGQSYLGSFSVFVLSGLANLLGHGPSTIKLLPIIFTWLAYLMFTLALARRYPWGALFFFALAILISPGARWWTVMQRGPAEHLFTLAVVLLVWQRWQNRRAQDGRSSATDLAVLGFVLGFATWNHLGMGLILLPLLMQEILARPGYGEWRRRFRVRDLLNWSGGGHRLRGRRLFATVIILTVLAEVVALIASLGGARIVPEPRATWLLSKLRYPVVLGVIVLLVLTWYHNRLAYRSGKRLMSKPRLAFLAGFIVGVLPAMAGMLHKPGRIQFPMPAMLTQIPAQVFRVLPDAWRLLFGLNGNPSRGGLTLLVIAVLIEVVWTRRHVWGDVLRLRPAQMTLEDVLVAAIILDILIFLFGDLAPGSLTGYRYLVPLPMLLAALVAVFIEARAKGERIKDKVRNLSLIPSPLSLYFLGLALAILAVTIPGQFGNLRYSAELTGSRLLSEWNRLEQEPATDSLLRVCRALNVRHLEGDYWQAYRLTYLSDENLIVAPITGVDRYPSYRKQVEADPDRGYVARSNDTLVTRFRALAGLREMAIGDYRLFVPLVRNK